MRDSYSGSTLPCQGKGAGPIPVSRSAKKYSSFDEYFKKLFF